MKQKKLVYIASPYTDDDPTIVEQRVEAVTHCVARIIDACPGIVPFSPITYTHPIDKLVKRNVDWVNDIDLTFLDKCDALIVLQLQGWSASKGVQEEILHARENNIPVYFATPESIVDSLTQRYPIGTRKTDAHGNVHTYQERNT